MEDGWVFKNYKTNKVIKVLIKPLLGIAYDLINSLELTHHIHSLARTHTLAHISCGWLNYSTDLLAGCTSFDHL